MLKYLILLLIPGTALAGGKLQVRQNYTSKLVPSTYSLGLATSYHVFGPLEGSTWAGGGAISKSGASPWLEITQGLSTKAGRLVAGIEGSYVFDPDKKDHACSAQAKLDITLW